MRTLVLVSSIVLIALFAVGLAAQDKKVPKIDAMSMENVQMLIHQFRQVDPYGEEFTVDGKIDAQTGPMYRGSWTLSTLQQIAHGNKYLGQMFSAMPTTAKRQLLQQATPVVVNYITEYAHPDLVRAWVTSLDWKRDIERVNPGMYHQIKWPDDRTVAVDVPGYDQASKLNYWVRMFWLRRGEVVFNTVKATASKALAKKR